MKWLDLQTELADALLDPDKNPSPAIKPLKNGELPVKRLNVYRNNVNLSIINVLKETYPTVTALVGDEFFATMAKSYIARHLPDSPVMLEYGGKFSDFIQTFEPAKQLAYLADVAALEWAMNQANHAADEQPLSVESLQAFDDEDLPNLQLKLHPSLHLVRSPYPIVGIWHAHQQNDPAEQLKALPDSGEIALIIRPELSVETRVIQDASFRFINAIRQGKSFGEAIGAALELDKDFNIAENLSGLFGAGAVTAIGSTKNI